MASLYEINNELVDAFARAIDPETGEIINEQALEELEKLQMAFDCKVENVALYIKNLTADAEAYKKEKMAFAERQQQAEKKVESLKKYLSKALAGEKFTTERVAVSFRKSESVNVLDMSKLDDDYLKYKDPEVDKTKVKKALKAGVALQGVELVTNNNIQIK